jgi:TolB-like protein/DNA-binding winged helix-turn-helix (wHTH) protein/tetratricopeptide (TPR) repeat protein
VARLMAEGDPGGAAGVVDLIKVDAKTWPVPRKLRRIRYKRAKETRDMRAGPRMTDHIEPPAERYAFEHFVLDAARGVLLGAGAEIRLRPKSYELLLYLVRHPGRLVGREELLDAIWGRVAVTDDSLTQCLVEIRRALNDGKRRIVRTVPRRGYIFDVPVTRLAAAASPADARATGGLAGGARADDGRGPAGGAVGTPRAGGRGPAHPEGDGFAATMPRRAIAGAGILAGILVAAVLFGWALGQRNAMPELEPEGSPPLPNSIAVLPFVDMSAEKDQEYFGDGLAEEILNLLVQSPELTVIARTSSFSFKDQPVDIATISRRLGVEHVLEGSVRKSGNRIRVTAQLVGAKDSAHLWSETYDRELDDLFGVQTEIASAVAEVLETKVLDGRPARPGRPVDLRAYDHQLRARFFFNRRATGDLELAREHLLSALAQDPDYALAWAGLSGVYGAQMSVGELDRDSGVPLRRVAAERALALDDRLPEAHLRAAAAFHEDGDLDRAREHMRLAQALDPENPLLLGYASTQRVIAGENDHAVRLWDRIVLTDPLSRVARNNRARHLLAVGRLDDARADLEAINQLTPGRANETETLLALILVLEDRYEEALEVLEGVSEMHEWGRERELGLALAHHALGDEAKTAAVLSRLEADDTSSAAHVLAEIHAHLGRHEEAISWLSEAKARTSSEAPWTRSFVWAHRANNSLFLRPLRDNPQWAALHSDVPPAW